MNHLFSPFQLGPLRLKNRWVMAPMTRSASPGHVPNQLNVDYYRRRAEHSVALIITEGTCVSPEANGYPDVPFFYGDEALKAWQLVADAVHEAGGLIMPQLWHVGGVRKDCLQPDESLPALSPSGLLSPNRSNGRALTLAEIEAVQQAFVDAAVAAKRLGFDGVELHGAHGYLLDQFCWDQTNRRTDQYGGSVINRSRFTAEIIAGIKAVNGVDFPVILRCSQWKLQDYGARLAQTPQQLEQVLRPMVDAGVDLFHCSTRRFWEPEFSGSDLNLAGWVRELTEVPTITVGSVGLTQGFIDEENRGIRSSAGLALDQFKQLDAAVARDEYDLVAVGRSLLQDPEWVSKVQAKQFDQLADYSASALKRVY